MLSLLVSNESNTALNDVLFLPIARCICWIISDALDAVNLTDCLPDQKELVCKFDTHVCKSCSVMNWSQSKSINSVSSTKVSISDFLSTLNFKN